MEVNVNPECGEDEIHQMKTHCAAIESPMKKMVIAGNPSSLEFDDFLNQHTQNQFVRGWSGCSLPCDQNLTLLTS